MDPRDKGFEALLKPLQDVLCKNWAVTLAQYLETYILHLHSLDNGAMNFSEAALLLQNSSKFYSKRVDLVFNFMIKLIESLQSGNPEIESNEDGPVKKKKAAKVLQCEGMESLSFVYSDHSVDIKVEKKDKADSEKKTVVLNTSMKVPCKANTSYLIYSKPGTDMGYKDEYRLNWRISSSGTLTEDFRKSENLNLTRVREQFNEVFEEMEQSYFDDDNREENEMELEPQGVEPLLMEAPSPVPPLFSSPHESPGRENNQNCNNQLIEKNVQKDDPWAPLSSDYSGKLLRMKKKRNYTLPKSLLTSSQAKKRASNGDDKNSVSFEAETYLCHTALLYDKNVPRSPLEYKVKQENDRKTQIILRRRMGNRHVRRAGIPFEEDFLGFSVASDFEDDLDDDNVSIGGGSGDGGGIGDEGGDEVPELDLSQINVPVPLEVREEREDAPGDTYERDAFVTMQRYQEAKRENACLSHEIAQRVAAWHESIQHVLIEAEQRSEFDIQDYGTQILKMFPEEKKHPVVSFRKIAKGKPQKEICRYFLSTLVLTNTYNLEIVKTNQDDLAKDCLEFKLLSRTRHHDEIDKNIGEASGGVNDGKTDSDEESDDGVDEEDSNSE